MAWCDPIMSTYLSQRVGTLGASQGHLGPRVQIFIRKQSSDQWWHSIGLAIFSFFRYGYGVSKKKRKVQTLASSIPDERIRSRVLAWTLQICQSTAFFWIPIKHGILSGFIFTSAGPTIMQYYSQAGLVALLFTSIISLVSAVPIPESIPSSTLSPRNIPNLNGQDRIQLDAARNSDILLRGQVSTLPLATRLTRRVRYYRLFPLTF